jgi:hypothetical protein
VPSLLTIFSEQKPLKSNDDGKLFFYNKNITEGTPFCWENYFLFFLLQTKKLQTQWIKETPGLSK